MKLNTRIVLGTVCGLVILTLLGCAELQPQTSTNPQTSQVVTNGFQYVLPAAATNIPATIQNIAPLLPPPFGELAGAAATVALAGMGLFIRVKNAQLASSGSALNAIVHAATTQGVPTELGNAIAQAATDRGVADHPAITAIKTATE